MATALLVLGVIFAARQLRQDRLFNRVAFTGDIFKRWNRSRYWDARSWMDETSDPEANRQRVTRVYLRLLRLKAFKEFRVTYSDVLNYINEISLLADRIGLYIDRGIIDIELVAEHIGYDIITLYYHLQDVYQQRAESEDENHEGFRDLALRIQHHARLNDIDLRDEVIWAFLPPLFYKGEDESEPYKMRRLKRWRLKQARLEHFGFRRTPASVAILFLLRWLLIPIWGVISE